MSNFFLSAYREFGQLVIYNLPIVKKLPTLCIRWWCIYLRTKPHSETGLTEPGRVFILSHSSCFFVGQCVFAFSDFLVWFPSLIAGTPTRQRSFASEICHSFHFLNLIQWQSCSSHHVRVGCTHENCGCCYVFFYQYELQRSVLYKGTLMMICTLILES